MVRGKFSTAGTFTDTVAAGGSCLCAHCKNESAYSLQCKFTGVISSFYLRNCLRDNKVSASAYWLLQTPASTICWKNRCILLDNFSGLLSMWVRLENMTIHARTQFLYRPRHFRSERRTDKIAYGTIHR